LEDGTSQSRSPVQALLDRQMLSRQSLAGRLVNGMGKGGQGEGFASDKQTLLPRQGGPAHDNAI
jgi:hypothetical protein